MLGNSYRGGNWRGARLALGMLLAIAGSMEIVAQQPAWKTGGKVTMQAAKAPSGTDKKFMATLAIGNRLEVELGQMAQAKASNPMVKRFAARMAADHSRAQAELQPLARAQQVTLPRHLDPRHAAAKNGLATQSGAAFDHAYMRLMVMQHAHTRRLIEHELNSSGDSAVLAYARKLLPVIESHLRQAQRVAARLRASRPGGH